VLLLQLVNSDSLTALQNKTPVYPRGKMEYSAVRDYRLIQLTAMIFKVFECRMSLLSKLQLMLIPNVFVNTFNDKMHTQKITIHSSIFSLFEKL
jgi:hypothetical protein